ncbi:MAG: hypothetical protein ACE5KT_08745 [Methanosarcinales archaeon]
MINANLGISQEDIQYITIKGNKAVVIDYDEFNALMELLNDMEDLMLSKDKNFVKMLEERLEASENGEVMTLEEVFND